MISLIIFGILIILLYIGYVFSRDADYESIFVACMIVFSIGFGEALCQADHKQTPQAIEVHQGKTTLEKTYQDSIAVDSVVIYKNK